MQYVIYTKVRVFIMLFPFGYTILFLQVCYLHFKDDDIGWETGMHDSNTGKYLPCRLVKQHLEKMHLDLSDSVVEWCYKYMSWNCLSICKYIKKHCCNNRKLKIFNNSCEYNFSIHFYFTFIWYDCYILLVVQNS